MAFAHPIGGVRPVRSSRRRGYFVPVLLLTPAMLWLTVFFVVPTISLASQSLQTGDIDNGYTLTWNFQTYADALARYWPHFLRSFGYAATATVGTLLLGYPLAWFIAHRSGKYKNALLVLVVAPFFTNFLIRTLAWQIILTDTGPVTGFFRATGLTSVLQAVGLTNNDTLLFSPFAVVSGLVYNFLPFMVLPLYANLVKLDHRLLEAAYDLGARPWQAFMRITLPLSRSGIVAGCMLVMIPAVGEFVIPEMLGGPDTLMIGRVLWGEFFNNRDWPLASAVAIVMLLLLLVPILIFNRSQQRTLEGKLA